VRATALLLLLGGIACALPGCGASRPTPAELKLQREDLVAVSSALKSLEAPVARELATTKRAWPLVVDGLPAGSVTSVRAPAAAAAESAAKIMMPALLQETQADSLTGPAAALAGMFRTYDGLATRGWQLISEAIDQIEAGARAPAASGRARTGASGRARTGASGGARTGASGGARTGASGRVQTGASGSRKATLRALARAKFARENVGLYIESVYDGHFDLAQIAKRLRKGYHNLGGAAAFAGSLTPAEVNSLANAYSEATARLHPHVGVKLGS